MSDEQSRPFDLPGHTVITEPDLRFGSNERSAVDQHPLRGLLQFGPFSRGKLTALPDPIRVAMVAPHGATSKLRLLLEELERSHQPRERKRYVPEFLGFSRVFGVGLAQAVGPSSFEMPADLTDKLHRSERPHVVLAEALTRAVQTLRRHALDFDVAMVLLARDWEVAFEAKEDGFDLHHYLKATAAAEGICIQIVRESGALEYYCRCSVAWRLSIAMYTKAGGVPWVLADGADRTAYVGISYALRPGAGDRYAICCSQVFDAEGSGLEFVAYEADDVRVFGRNPFLSREQMLRVMSRTIAIYRHKHAGASPRRVVVHKNTEFKRDEVNGCFDALAACPEIELVHVQQASGWRGVLFEAPRMPHAYPCPRGAALQIGPYETLLWTQGNAPSIVSGGDFYKEGKGIPEPLLLVRYAGHGPMDDLCRSTLALTKMDWNNDGPYDRLPVTLKFAQMLAEVVQRMPRLEARPYPFRLFM
jgi:hypothetical protein